MRSVHDFTKVLIHREPVDMRRGINGLCDIVQSSGMGNLMERNLFLFTGKRRHSIKLLYFDKSGFCLWQKRLDTDQFPWPKKLSDEIIHINPEQLAWLIEGYDVWKMKPFAQRNFERVS